MKIRHRGIVVLHPKVKITEADKQALRDAGYIPIEGESSQVVVRSPFGAEVSGDLLTMAALKTVADPASPARQQQFGRLILDHTLAHAGLAYSADGQNLVRI